MVRVSDIERPFQVGDFFLSAFRFSRKIGRQELRCSANDGYFTTSVPCPKCLTPLQGEYLRGIYRVPRLILYVPFVLVFSLAVVRATGGMAFIIWPLVTNFFGWIYRCLFCRGWPWIGFIFEHPVAYSFYKTNEAHQLL